MVIYHTERALPDVRHPVTAVTGAYDPTAGQKIVGSGNEDGAAMDSCFGLFYAYSYNSRTGRRRHRAICDRKKNPCSFFNSAFSLRSMSGERILFVSLLSGCCTISGFRRHLGLAKQSPRFTACESFESRWLSEVPRVDSIRSECHAIFTSDRTHFTNP